MTLFTLSVDQQIPQETKHRANISRCTSNNSSQAQEFNIPDVLENSLSHNTQSSKQALSLSLLLVWQSSIYSKAWLAKFTILQKILEYAAVIRFLLVLQTRDLQFLEHSIFAKNVTQSLNLANLSPKMTPSSSKH